MSDDSPFSGLKPWVIRPFELLFHAEVHFQNGTDYDKSLALISFDNSIEVSITTYLNLNPIQREDRTYPRDKVKEWLKNYYTKINFFIDFFLKEINSRNLPAYGEKDTIIWYHTQRNNYYHKPTPGVPPVQTLDGIRQIALWIFSILFQVSDVEKRLKSAITESEKTFPEIPKDYTTPKIEGIKQEHATPLFIAAILGGWNEKSQGDNNIIEEITSGC